MVEKQILDDVRSENDGNEIYNLLVHDRIRVLEQKEKILRRQSPSAPSVNIFYSRAVIEWKKKLKLPLFFFFVLGLKFWHDQ